jgi:maestro heat-like repeat-containing protein family member 1
MQLIVVMASHCYLSGHPAELAVEFLVWHSAITDDGLSDLNTLKNEYFQDKRYEVLLNSRLCVIYMFMVHTSAYLYFNATSICQMKISLAGLSELRAVCEKGLLLLAITVPEMKVKVALSSTLIESESYFVESELYCLLLSPL